MIRRDLKQRIIGGEFASGEWLPTRSQLQFEYHVSQTPIRRALTELEQMGLIRSHQGRGSVVRSQRIVASLPMMGFGSELRGSGRQVDVKVTSSKEVASSRLIAEELGLTAGTTVWQLCRIFVVDGHPLAYFEHHLGLQVLPYLARTSEASLNSLYTYLSQIGLNPEWARESITADGAGEQQMKHLEIAQGEPLLRRDRITFLASDEPIEKVTYWIRSSAYSMDLELRNMWS